MSSSRGQRAQELTIYLCACANVRSLARGSAWGRGEVWQATISRGLSYSLLTVEKTAVIRCKFRARYSLAALVAEGRRFSMRFPPWGHDELAVGRKIEVPAEGRWVVLYEVYRVLFGTLSSGRSR